MRHDIVVVLLTKASLHLLAPHKGTQLLLQVDTSGLSGVQSVPTDQTCQTLRAGWEARGWA